MQSNDLLSEPLSYVAWSTCVSSLITQKPDLLIKKQPSLLWSPSLVPVTMPPHPCWHISQHWRAFLYLWKNVQVCGMNSRISAVGADVTRKINICSDHEREWNSQRYFRYTL